MIKTGELTFKVKGGSNGGGKRGEERNRRGVRANVDD